MVEAQGPLLDPKVVAEGLATLVADEARAGAVMRVTNHNGVDYQFYPYDPAAEA